MAAMTFGSLFSGIGGIDLGLERAGLECKWQVENDSYALQVLAKHWPSVPRYRDVRYFLGSKRWRRAREAWGVDVVAGGFPCQDISNAGRRAGIDGKRSGLWSEYARIVRLLRPPYVFVENVAALTIRGLGRVVGDLAACGYDAEWSCLPAAAVGAPHARWRLFLLAYRQPRAMAFRGDGCDADSDQHKSSPSARQEDGETSANGCAASDADSRWAGQRWREQFAAYCESQGNLFWPQSEPGICGVADGVPYRVDRLRGLGNAVIPQLAEWIGRRIIDHQEDKL